MKIALISDVHGNLEALDSVFKDIDSQGVENIHFLGDAVGYGSNPNECLKKISKLCDIKLLGNHDYAALGLESTRDFNETAKKSMEWTQENLSKKSIKILSSFELETEFLDSHLVHASPKYPDQWYYILNTEQALESFDDFDQSVCFVGHSHIPAIFRKDTEGNCLKTIADSFQLDDVSKYIINVGSVGQPRDNDPRACYLIYDTENRFICYQRIEYDYKKTQDKMRKADLPEFLIDRLAVGV